MCRSFSSSSLSKDQEEKLMRSPCFSFCLLPYFFPITHENLFSSERGRRSLNRRMHSETFPLFLCHIRLFFRVLVRCSTMNNTEHPRSTPSSLLSGSSLIHYLQILYVPCLTALGIAGNLICAIVFASRSSRWVSRVEMHHPSPRHGRSFRRIRSSSYLFVLAISDVVFLIDLLPGWINTNFDRSLYLGANSICQMQTYISFVVAVLHIWMVLAFTAERCFAVNFPLRHMSQWTTRFSRTMILLIVLPASLFYIYPSFFASEVDKHGQCREKASHVHYLNRINTIDTIMTMFLPFIVVSIFNILIIRKLFCSKAFRQHVFENGSSYQYHYPSNWTPTLTRSVKKDGQVDASTISIRRKVPHGPESARRHVLTEVRLTKMLLAISLTCLSLNFPSYYSRVMTFYEQTKDDSSEPERFSTFIIYREILFHYLSYLSYSINIFIYILFGANFRRALKRIFFSKTPLASTSFRRSIGEIGTSFNHSPRKLVLKHEFIRANH